MSKIIRKSAPTIHTPGTLGQECYDKNTGKTYVCTKVDIEPGKRTGEADGVYTWEESSGGSSPQKLSDLENDLFYAKEELLVTLTEEDFGMMTLMGNEMLVYKGTLPSGWTEEMSLGFVTDWDGEYYTHGVTSFVKDDADVYPDDDYVEIFDYPWGFGKGMGCGECAIEVHSGVNLEGDEPIPENVFYIASFDGVPTSIFVYAVNAKKIPENLVDTANIRSRIIEIGYEIGNVHNVANNAQTAANNAQTAANNAQTAADNAMTIVDVNTEIPTGELNIQGFNKLVYGNGVYLAVPYLSRSYIARSIDGIDWEFARISDIYSGATSDTNILDIRFLNDKFILAVSTNSISGKWVMWSEDGFVWNGDRSILHNIQSGGAKIFYHNNNYYFYGYYDTSATMKYSADLTTWYEIANAPTDIQSMYCVNNRFILFYGNNTDGYQIKYSDDGAGWVKGSSMITRSPVLDLTYGNGRYVAITFRGDIWYSDDCDIWMCGRDSNNDSIEHACILYHDGKYLAYTNRNVIVSENCVAWNTDYHGAYTYKVVKSDNEFVAVYPFNKIVSRSPNGIEWTTTHKQIFHNGTNVTKQIKEILGLI